ncbi:MAG: PQQ-binding-like beta-propeller repeat protein [Candidatus Thermoplasmatota archaeon]|nr:PQQ-binding-like beta-propeller repeat protein [Candidatus Thermoplasmatota archaeon]
MKNFLVPLVVLILLVCLVPVQASNQVDSSPESDEQYLSSIELFLQRKAYPYEYKALEYQKYFTQGPSDSDVYEHIAVSSSFPSSIGLSGPMNSSWPMKSFNAQHIGRTTSSTADNPGIEKWRFQTYINGVDSGAAIANNDIIYFGSQDYRLYALYPNGTLLWFYQTGDPIFSDPAIAEDGTIYFTSCDHYLYALNPDGSLKWRFNTGQIISSSPIISSNGTIYIGHSQGRVYAISPNGIELWHYDLPNDIYGSAALGFDGTIYIGSWDNNLYALNPDGTLQWSFSTGDHVKGIPSIASDGTIYFGSWDGYLYALNPNGTMRWRSSVGSGTETTPALAEDGTIYVGGNELYAVYPNGIIRWSLNTGGFIFHSCPAIAAEGTIYVGVNIGNSMAGKIIAVNPNGTIRWQTTISDETAESSPVIARDGTVYIGSSGIYYGTSFHAFGGVESNTPPNPPEIEGITNGKAGTEYSYLFQISDPENNPVQVYIEWGDGKNEWSYITASGRKIQVFHTWAEQGTYIIKAKARDTLGAESNWTSMEVTMPYSYEPQFPFIQWLLEQFPNAFPLLRHLVGLI